MLPANPALGPSVVIVIYREGETILWVITTCEVAQNGVSLKYAQTIIVMINQGRDAAIGIDGGKPRLLLDVFANVNSLNSIV